MTDEYEVEFLTQVVEINQNSYITCTVVCPTTALESIMACVRDAYIDQLDLFVTGYCAGGASENCRRAIFGCLIEGDT